MSTGTKDTSGIPGAERLRRRFARLLEQSSGTLARLAQFVKPAPGRESEESLGKKSAKRHPTRRPVGNPSFRTRVFRTSAAATLLFTAVTGGVLFFYAYEEASEHQDDTLEEVSGVIARFVISGKGADAAKWPLDAAFVFSMDDDDLEDVYEMGRASPSSFASTFDRDCRPFRLTASTTACTSEHCAAALTSRSRNVRANFSKTRRSPRSGWCFRSLRRAL